MPKKALLVIDIQNDITKNYKEVIDNINSAIKWAEQNNFHIVYIKHEDLSANARIFKPNTSGVEFVPDLKIVSNNIFTKHKPNVLTCKEFSDFITENELCDFYITGADASICVKSTCYNLRKKDFEVTVLSNCIASYDKRKIDEMLHYYKSKGAKIITVNDLL